MLGVKGFGRGVIRRPGGVPGANPHTDSSAPQREAAPQPRESLLAQALSCRAASPSYAHAACYDPQHCLRSSRTLGARSSPCLAYWHAPPACHETPLPPLTPSYSRRRPILPLLSPPRPPPRDEHYGFQLYQSDPSGNYGGWKAVAIGAGHQAANNVLKSDYKVGPGGRGGGERGAVLGPVKVGVGTCR